jgi:ribonuclease PH
MSKRIDSRQADELRPIGFQTDIARNAHGSVRVNFGDTEVICAAMIEEGVPRWMKAQGVAGGWLTAEYSMLPYSTLDRKPRDSSRGRVDGRSTEIQRLIGRSLRAVVNLKALGARTLWVDCDVLRADGGTRTASITGACVAAEMAFQRLIVARKLTQSPMPKLAAGISAGVFQDECILDLNYHEDKDASVDFNYVMTEDADMIEVQGSGEEATFSEAQMLRMLELAKKGAAEIGALQRSCLEGFDATANLEIIERMRR